MKVGVIGCGSIGRRYVQWLAELGVDVGACDIDIDNLNRISIYSKKNFTDQEELFNWGIEKLIIATPPLYHAQPALMAMEKNIDLLIEKPLAAGIADAERMVARAKDNNSNAWVVCNMRFHPGIVAIADNLEQIGPPLCVRAYFSHRLSQMRPTGVDVYAASEEKGGGVILDCIHEFDVLQYLLGPMSSIRGWCDQIGEDKINAYDVADIQIQFSNGCHGIVHFDFLSRLKRRGLEIIGEKATSVWASQGKTPEICSVTLGTNEKNHILLNDDDVDGFKPYRIMLEKFLRGGDGLQSIQEALQSLRFALAATSPEWKKLS
jgi:predicted dehydrogenase